jgi:RNA polymerase sigma-70 factor (ECF subfamily)
VRERTLETERRRMGEECEPPSDELLENLQTDSRIHAALATLTPLRRELVALAFLNGMSHEEIAATHNLALGTVKSHIRRALSTLRTTLEEENGSG